MNADFDGMTANPTGEQPSRNARRVFVIKQRLPLFSLDNPSRKPSLKEIIRQYLHMVNPRRDKSHWLNVHLELHFYLGMVFSVFFVLNFLTFRNALVVSSLFYLLANFYNTVWYHRYCSHASFAFSHPIFPKLLLWFNPVAYREEVYVLNHLLHHAHSDSKEDPYGPHYGWLGNFFASPFFKVDRDITKPEFEKLKTYLKHVGIHFSTYENFREWGSVESVSSFLMRSTFSTILWAGTAWLIGGLELLSMWFVVLFAFHAVARDFNFRGHGGSSEAPKHVEKRDFDRSTRALNQWFYGITAGEWHNNHHAFQGSANTGFQKYQFDIPFLMIRCLHKLRVVKRYRNFQFQFKRKYLS